MLPPLALARRHVRHCRRVFPVAPNTALHPGGSQGSCSQMDVAGRRLRSVGRGHCLTERVGAWARAWCIGDVNLNVCTHATLWPSEALPRMRTHASDWRLSAAGTPARTHSAANARELAARSLAHRFRLPDLSRTRHHFSRGLGLDRHARRRGRGGGSGLAQSAGAGGCRVRGGDDRGGVRRGCRHHA